ncbi:MAG: N-acyl homoserine lactonase family protein [Caulobacteraceae bacterium]|nr:N-acyl homoserine lactonase family protein [Caulobacteraceae bacterium]
MTLKLYAFSCGLLNLRHAFLVDGKPGRVIVPVPVYLIDHPKGRALFDTGLGLRFRRPVGAPLEGNADMDESADVAARLRAMDIDPASIRYIINSHLHADHAGGNAFIPNATMVIQAIEWDYAKSGEDKFFDPAEFDIGHPVMKLHGEHDLYGDGSVVLFPTPGHTPGHQSARVKLPGGDVVLAADCCNMRASLDEMTLPDHIHDAEAAMATLAHLRDLRAAGARIFYGHDHEFWATLPQSTALT